MHIAIAYYRAYHYQQWSYKPCVCVSRSHRKIIHHIGYYEGIYGIKKVETRTNISYYYITILSLIILQFPAPFVILVMSIEVDFCFRLEQIDFDEREE